MLDGGDMAQVRAIMFQKEREEVYAALQYAASFHSLVEEWKDCEELKTKAERKVDLCRQKKESTEASHGVVCGSKHIPLYDMREKQQTHEHARKM